MMCAVHQVIESTTWQEAGTMHAALQMIESTTWLEAGMTCPVSQMMTCPLTGHLAQWNGIISQSDYLYFFFYAESA